MAAQEAGIVVGHGGIDHLDGLDTALLDQLIDVLAVVQHLVIAAKLGILVTHGIETMGAYGHYLGDLVAVQHHQVTLCQSRLGTVAGPTHEVGRGGRPRTPITVLSALRFGKPLGGSLGQRSPGDLRSG